MCGCLPAHVIDDLSLSCTTGKCLQITHELLQIACELKSNTRICSPFYRFFARLCKSHRAKSKQTTNSTERFDLGQNATINRFSASNTRNAPARYREADLLCGVGGQPTAFAAPYSAGELAPEWL